MKKTLLIVMILSLLFSVLGCDQKQQEKTDEKPITTATTAVQDATTTTAATTAATTATTAATVSTSTDANDTLSSDTSFGSRNSPVKVGETVSLQSTSFAFDITLNSITRGADATNLVKDSPGAPPIPAGKELIIANITLILNKSSQAADIPFGIGYLNFRFYDSTFSGIQGFSGDANTLQWYTIPDQFDYEQLAVGASKTGNICVVVDEGTQNYASLYDNCWFDLSGS